MFQCKTHKVICDTSLLATMKLWLAVLMSKPTPATATVHITAAVVVLLLLGTAVWLLLRVCASPSAAAEKAKQEGENNTQSNVKETVASTAGMPFLRTDTTCGRTCPHTLGFCTSYMPPHPWLLHVVHARTPLASVRRTCPHTLGFCTSYMPTHPWLLHVFGCWRCATVSHSGLGRSSSPAHLFYLPQF